MNRLFEKKYELTQSLTMFVEGFDLFTTGPHVEISLFTKEGMLFAKYALDKSEAIKFCDFFAECKKELEAKDDK